MTEETLFELLVKTPEAERVALLDRECAGQPALRARLEALLEADAASSPLSLQPRNTQATAVFQATSNYTTSEPRPGVVIAGRYTLEHKLGEGGMGEVWVAKQNEPVKRNVALKLIKAGMDSRSVIQRFEQERQALAMMDHPNIAKVLDGGLTEDRHPFFVMELVNGLPLTKFCDKAKLGIRERLELFIPICQAVQHAHQKGIVHRDLKPGNILVTMLDGKPVPKVIDFGVAKATSGRITEDSLSTQFGAVVGTLEYMSPEQAGFSSEDIDTRADIYSLGVILYELLTGLRPFDSKRLKQAALDEMVRIIREEEPSKPSTRLSTDESLPSLAAVRHIDPSRLTALLRGELDWVVMKCLEKQRDRRYESANGLARDIQRYLADEVVEARPPSTGYRLKKFVRRHYGQVIAAIVVLFALLAAIAGTSWGLFEAKKQESLARDETIAKEKARAAEAEQRLAAEKAAGSERQAREQTQKRLTQIEKGINVFAEMLQGINPLSEEKEGKPLLDLLRERAEKAAEQVQAEALADPLVEARLQTILGSTLQGLGSYTTAIEVLERARVTREQTLGVDHLDTRTTLHNPGMASVDAGRRTSIPLLERVRNARMKQLGPNHPDTLTTLHSLAVAYQTFGRTADAIPLFEQVRDAQVEQLGADHRHTLTTINSLAASYRVAGRPADAIALLEQVREAMVQKLGADHAITLASLNNLASAYRAAGRPAEAIPLFEQVRDAMVQKLGADHPSTLATLNNLAMAYFGNGRMAEAIALHERVRDAKVKKLGSDHPETLTTLSNLASAYRATGRTADAITLYEKVREVRIKKLGPDHPSTLTTLHNLALAYSNVGRTTEAIQLNEQVRAIRVKKLGPDHPDTLFTLHNLADLYKDVGRTNDALTLYQQVRDARVKKLGIDHPDTLTTLNNLATTYWELNRLDQSIPLLEDILPRSEKKLGRQHPGTILIIANLGVNYKDAGRLTEAIPLLEEANRTTGNSSRLRWVPSQLLNVYVKAGRSNEAAQFLKDLLADAGKQLPKDSPQRAGLLAQLGWSLLDAKGYAEAEPLLREGLSILNNKKDPADWRPFHLQCMLGAVLLGQKKYAEAEQLLLAGYAGLSPRRTSIAQSVKFGLPDALDRLIQLYTETSKPDEVKKWQAEKERLQKLTNGGR